MALEREPRVARDLPGVRQRSAQLSRGRLMSRQDVDQFAEWLKEHRVGEVECLVSDMAGIARGKILPTNKFLAGLRNQTLRLPESVFGQMVTGADAETEVLSYQSPDMNLVPDVDSL